MLASDGAGGVAGPAVLGVGLAVDLAAVGGVLVAVEVAGVAGEAAAAGGVTDRRAVRLGGAGCRLQAVQSERVPERHLAAVAGIRVAVRVARVAGDAAAGRRCTPPTGSARRRIRHRRCRRCRSGPGRWPGSPRSRRRGRRCSRRTPGRRRCRTRPWVQVPTCPGPAGQTWPQAPQFSGSFATSVSQPSAAAASQSAKPAWADEPQVPPEQVPAVFAGAVQAWPQAAAVRRVHVGVGAVVAPAGDRAAGKVRAAGGAADAAGADLAVGAGVPAAAAVGLVGARVHAGAPTDLRGALAVIGADGLCRSGSRHHSRRGPGTARRRQTD